MSANRQVARLCRALVRGFALLAPGGDRARWRTEWMAEIDHAVRRSERHSVLVRRSLLSLRDALQLRARRTAPGTTSMLRAPVGHLLDELQQDVRFGARSLLRSPGFAAVAILTMAVGIGATTTIFSLVNGILLRPLPYQDPDRLVVVWPENWFSTNLFLEIEPFLDSFEAAAGHTASNHTLITDDGAVRVQGPQVTARFLDLLRPRLQLGRGFAPDEDRRGTRVVVISDRFWRERMESDPHVVGRTVRLNGQEHAVVGVLAPGYQSLRNGASLIVPWQLDTDFPAASSQEMKLFGRLAEGVSREAALEELRAYIAYLHEQYDLPADYGNDATIQPLHEYLVGDTRPTLLLLFGAVGLTLLIATANVANLLLSRALTREREVAVRAALGAGRGRLVRQMMTESSLLGLVGMVPGLMLASVGLNGVLALMPAEAPRLESVALDGSVLAFSILLALATGWIVGVIPALQSSRSDVRAALATGGRGGSESARRRHTRRAVVLAEVAMAVTLVAGSGLLIKSFLQVTRVDPGFRPQALAVFDLRPEEGSIGSAAEATQYFDRIRSELDAIPGIAGISEVWKVPFSEDGGINSLYRGDREIDPTVDPPFGRWRPVRHDYFATAGIRLVRGRLFDAADEASTEQVAVISEATARSLFGMDDPLGELLLTSIEMETPARVVGVVGDLRLGGLDQASTAVVYRPYAQMPGLLERYGFYGRWIVLRLEEQAPAGLATTVRDVVRGIDPTALIAGYTTMSDAIRVSLSQRRGTMTLLGLFAGTALLLGAVGIYGVLAYSVRSRRREIGIRVALGATRGHIVRGVLRDALSLAILGSAVGMGLTVLLSRTLDSFLFEVSPLDPWVLTAAVATAALLAVASALQPALRAGRQDPASTLSEDG